MQPAEPASETQCSTSSVYPHASSGVESPPKSCCKPPEVGIIDVNDALSRGLVIIRHTGTSKGFGVYAAVHMSENTWLGDYIGEVLTQEEYLARYPNEDASYVLGCNEDYNIDAVNPAKSSFLRFLNHAPTPIANTFYEIIRKRKQRHKIVKFYTGRDVQEGEELTFDYGVRYWADRGLPPLVEP